MSDVCFEAFGLMARLFLHAVRGNEFIIIARVGLELHETRMLRI